MIFFPAVISAMPLGDDRTFMEWLYTKYHRLMFSAAWKYCGNRDMTEDIIGDSCVALMRNLPTLREMDERQISVYLYVTVRNTAFNALKKERRHSTRFLPLSHADMSALASDESPEANIELESLLQQVCSVLEALPEKEQEVSRLKFSLGLDNAAIARETGLSESSVRKYISRIREKVKEQLGMKGGSL